MSEKGKEGDGSEVTFPPQPTVKNNGSQDSESSAGTSDTQEASNCASSDQVRESEDGHATQSNPGTDNEPGRENQNNQATGAIPSRPATPEESEEKPEKDEAEQPATPPTKQRVRFRSDAKQGSGYPRSPGSEDERSELERTRRMRQPHPPSSPYSHERDVTDVPLRERAPDGGADREPSKEEKPEPGPVGRFQAASRSAQERLRATGKAIKEKSAKIAERFGRETHGGDDLTHAVYRPDWASGGATPLSHFMYGKDEADEQKKKEAQKTSTSEAHRLVRELTQGKSSRRPGARGKPYPHGGQDFPGQQGDMGIDSGLRYRAGGGGVLSQLMKLNGNQNRPGLPRSSSALSSDGAATPQTGTTTPGKEKPKWYKRQQYPPSASAAANSAETPPSDYFLSAASKRQGKGPDRQTTLEEEIQVTVEIAGIIARQRYIMELCKALMKFGAPTHRLEEYMQMSAKVLEVDGQFLYLPGCMIMSFDDPSTRTTEMKLVRVAEGIDLGRLAGTHSVYKNVVHDIIGVEEAIQELQGIINSKPRYNKWVIVFTYGLATTAVGPFAFDARPIDMPIIFFNGCLLAMMQHVLAPRSVLYSNVFEVTASVLTSFLARAFGSIQPSKGKTINGKPQFIFCFSAIAQSSIALILPGFLVLTSSLELQSHQIVAGSIRLVYAIIYALFLGYGITVGTTIYGLMDKFATSDTTCSKPSVDFFKSPYIQRFPFVAVMALLLVVVNQGRWKQAPVMVTIALSGYVTNFFCIQKLGSNSQVANTVGAFTIGIMGNLYSRLWHGHAATAILPGIFVLVPSGLAASGSIISGLESANMIRANVSQPGRAGQFAGAGLSNQTAILNLGFGMVQIAIGITIGLFLAALFIYPYGKRRSGLFSF